MMTPAAQAKTDPSLWALPFAPTEGALPPPAVQAHGPRLQQRVHQREQQVETLQGRVERPSHTSRQPPSSAAPFHKPGRKPRPSDGPRGARRGHPGTGPPWLRPTAVRLIEPAPGACGHGALVSLVPYDTHPVIALPPLERASTHCGFQQGIWAGWGTRRKAHVPPEPQAGSGPRWTALLGELAGMPRTPWRLVQAFCPSGLPMPRRLGAGHKVLHRGSQAMVPHSAALGPWARQAPGGSIDETPWDCPNPWQGLWPLTTAPVSLSLMPPHRSKEALAALIEDWQGLWGSDGDGVDQAGVKRRQTCLAHLSRTARGLSVHRPAALAACGAWALKAWPRWCAMAKAPPPGGEWRAWDARFWTLLERYHARQDDAGRWVRRLPREMASLGVFLAAQGVEPTNNRAERA